MVEMPKPSEASVPEVAIANSALMRAIVVYLLARGFLMTDHLDSLFDHAKEDIQLGRFGLVGTEGAIGFLDHLRRSIAINDEPREPMPTSDRRN
jgi:hypothetical protein